eukprot:CAMPEP_0196574668 /NCGR_PEP_ID=MMETSP1081-20130531/4334_1 /TAXON_ID=36882 /ORGANISM="Pyramimonas amylifera, Strain CCMP720" /LENGTH=657 /DNA_ID=CAMNT_0041892761 /DNA_START=107 /DNA_END=2080 /DNA_ORIENTATION=+
MDVVRGLVSKKKKRFREDGFNLDLSYITERIIAMGYPSEGSEGLYRNPMNEVEKFLNRRHKGHFRVYNLCSERSYKEKHFNGNWARYPFDDHQAPPYSMIREFCEDAHAWMSQDPEHIFVAHCKAGKGRTGVMICSYLMYAGLRLPLQAPLHFTKAEQALHFYADKRTKNAKGVTIASQRRYISYYASQLLEVQFKAKASLPPADPAPPQPPRSLVLGTIALESMPRDLDIIILILQRPLQQALASAPTIRLPSATCLPPPLHLVCASVAQPAHPDPSLQVIYNVESKKFVIRPRVKVALCGDVKMEIYEKNTSKANMLTYTWFNTDFLPLNGAICPYTLKRDELDKVHKQLPTDVQLSLTFRDQPSDPNAVVIAGCLVVESPSAILSQSCSSHSKHGRSSATSSYVHSDPSYSSVHKKLSDANTPVSVPPETSHVLSEVSHLTRPQAVSRELFAEDAANSTPVEVIPPLAESASIPRETPLQARLKAAALKKKRTSQAKDSGEFTSARTSLESNSVETVESQGVAEVATRISSKNYSSSVSELLIKEKKNLHTVVPDDITDSLSTNIELTPLAPIFTDPTFLGSKDVDEVNIQEKCLPSYDQVMSNLHTSLEKMDNLVRSLKQEEISIASMHDHLGIVLEKLKSHPSNQVVLCNSG